MTINHNEFPAPRVWETPEHPREVGGVPFGGPWAPYFYWPVRTLHSRGREVAFQGESGQIYGRPGRRFLATRETDDGRARYHVGVDLWGDEGDVVVACADGTVVNARFFYHGTYRVLVEHDACVINYGEVKKDSWREFGLASGSRVRAGDPIALVGKMDEDSMCHFEMYVSGTTDTARWYRSDDDPPEELLNPTAFLLRIAANGR
jgi:murein DD-endopeptidase MepM/ murein hydrolase activator NlpD